MTASASIGPLKHCSRAQKVKTQTKGDMHEKQLLQKIETGAAAMSPGQTFPLQRQTAAEQTGNSNLNMLSTFLVKKFTCEDAVFHCFL